MKSGDEKVNFRKTKTDNVNIRGECIRIEVPIRI